jgi:uncharacterized iron-regulated membrane protein
MKLNRILYALHRWIALIILVQLSLWVLTGAFFTLVSHDQLHGTHHGHHAPHTLRVDGTILGPDEVLRRLAARGVRDVTALELRPGGGETFWVANRGETSLRLRASDASVAPVERAEAEQVARDDQGGGVVAAARLYTSAAPLEYRKKPLPAWRVEFADGAGTAVWVDATRGVVVTRRNRVWRVYDFLWSLHIMDYWDRDNFHTPWMVAAAALALLTVASGAVIWGVRATRRWRRDSPKG